MSNKRTIDLKTYPQQDVKYTSPFSILPTNTTAPVITLQPLASLLQQTWVSKQELNPNETRYQKITPSSDIVTALQGTEISFQLFAGNYATQANGKASNKLQYKWRLNGSLVGNLNALNNYQGTNVVLITSESCTPLLSGEYVCEVTNEYGSVETEPFTLSIIDPFDHPKLYKNLVVNGSGEGGLDGWQAESDIKVTPFQHDLQKALNFSSFRLSGMIINDSGSNSTTKIRPEFRFSNAPHTGMFDESYRKRVANDPTFLDINTKSTADGILSYEEQYYSQGQIPQIVPNEDYLSDNDVAGFFPGIAWLDAYNKNTNQNIVSLQNELTSTSPTYFTREKIKFKTAGGKAQTSLSQTIDLTDIADMIDGNAYGITHTTSQFFAYVGAGITNYKIRLNTPEGIVEFPYYIGTSEEYAEMFASNFHNGENGSYAISSTYYDEDQQKWLTYDELKAAESTYDVPATFQKRQETNNFSDQISNILNNLNNSLSIYDGSTLSDFLIEAANSLPDDNWQWWYDIKTNFNNLISLLQSKNISPSETLNNLRSYLDLTDVPYKLDIDGYTDSYTNFSYTPSISALDSFYKHKKRVTEAKIAGYIALGPAASLLIWQEEYGHDFIENLPGLKIPAGNASDFRNSRELKRLVTKNLVNFLTDTIREIQSNILPNITATLTDIDKKLSKTRWIWDRERIASSIVQETRKRKISEYSDIEIIPVLDDQTKIQINYLDNQSNIIRTDTVNGPDAQTVWAIKEKVYFPLTLYPLFEFVKPNGNNRITVFDQKYTDTFTLGAFFNIINIGKGNGPLSKGINSLQEGNKITQVSIGVDSYFPDLNQAYFYGYDGANDQIRDINARFLMNKYNFVGYGGAYPPNNRDINPRGGLYSQNSYKAVYDFGAAAMFGVELTAAIPKNTRSVQIVVVFDHKSTIIDDNSPQTKGWTSSEIYSDEYGQSTGDSNRLVEYGNPRCGITSMKYIVAANNFEKTSKYPSYYIPPANATVLGLQKEKYLNPNAFNTADSPSFVYNLTLPTELPEL